MKINQLFARPIDMDLLLQIAQCFNIKSLDDKRSFSKYDMIEFKTTEKINQLLPEIWSYYIPCKAKMYLTELTEKKCITILKQILRLHGYALRSKERNVKNKKIIFYQVINENEPVDLTGMRQQTNLRKVISFNG
jgi:hypothetical protein